MKHKSQSYHIMTYQYIGNHLNELEKSLMYWSDSLTEVSTQLCWAISMVNFFQSLRERIPLLDKTEYIQSLYHCEHELLKKLYACITIVIQKYDSHEVQVYMKNFLVTFWFHKELWAKI